MKRQAVAKKVVIGEIRPLQRDDLSKLAEGRNNIALPQRLRESHHRVARLIAYGVSQGDVATAVGYSYNRISILLQSPAMKELVARYRNERQEQLLDEVLTYDHYAIENMVMAERQINDRLHRADEEDETLPIRELIAISGDRQDRFGVPKKSTNIHLGGDFAAALEAAIARSGKTIEMEPTETGSTSPTSSNPVPQPVPSLHSLPALQSVPSSPLREPVSVVSPGRAQAGTNPEPIRRRI